MYIYLEENTNTYHKGQLTPFFIAILTILIIGIMVTVNIGKVSQIKTHTSNSADAGALAAASAMGSSFNALGAYASYMYALYLDLKDIIEQLIGEAESATNSMMLYTFLAAIFTVIAAVVACYPAYGDVLFIIFIALALIMTLLATYQLYNQFGIMETTRSYIIGLHEQQQSIYTSMREMVDENLVSARESALNLGFSNSGIFAMLTDNQQDDYRDFIDNLDGSSNPALATYSWQDGQDRDHKVKLKVDLDEVTRYQLYQTNKDVDTITDDYYLLYYALYGVVSFMLGWLLTSYEDLLEEGGCGDGWEEVAWAITTVYVSFLFSPIFDKIEDGVQENGKFWSSSSDLGDTIATTLADVEHCRCLTFSSEQSHEGINLTLWETDYPDAVSEADASFSGGNLDGHGTTGVGHTPRLIEAR